MINSKTMSHMKENKVSVKLAAIDPLIVDNIVWPTEDKVRNKDFVSWGTNNKYPAYLWDLYTNVATLQSIINGSADFIVGNDVICNIDKFNVTVNKKGDTIVDIVRKIAVDKLIFGGYALQVIRNMVGEVNEIYHIDFMKIRSNEKNTVFYYADDWTAWSVKSIKYPKFEFTDKSPASIIYNKGYNTRSVYPIPMYGASILSCEIERKINEFHLNNLNNGFMGNCIINFNNGIPTDEEQAEIEVNVNEKFGGTSNAGRILMSFNDSEANKTTIDRLDADDFDEKYQALADRSRTEIFTAFRANPVLFGINYSSGFNENEFNEAFKLYNRTVIKPIQKDIIATFDKIFNTKSSITINPFSLETTDDKTVE